MKRILLALLLLVGITASAQDVYTSSGKAGYKKKTKKQKGYDPSKLIIGGGINAGFGDGYANVGISPIVGYHITEKFAAGIGLGYQYNQQPDAYSTYYTTYYDKESIVFPNLWARYFVWRGLYAVGQFEYDFIKYTNPLDNYGNPNATVSNLNAQCLLLGVGFKQPLGGRASVFFELMYDVLQQQYSPYLNEPVVKGGICVGL